MKASELHLKARYLSTDQNPLLLDVLDLTQGEIVLSPALAVPEGDLATVVFVPPSDLEFDHHFKDLSLPVHVARNGLSGLVLTLREMEPSVTERWNLILQHVEESKGRLARTCARMMISEYQLEVHFVSASPGRGKVFDLSTGGMSVVSEMAVEVGDEVEFRLDGPSSASWFETVRSGTWRGRVRNCRPYGFGVEFLEEGDCLKSRVSELLKTFSADRLRRLRYPRYNVYELEMSASVYVDNHAAALPVRMKNISVRGSYLLSNCPFVVDSVVRLLIPPPARLPAILNPLEVHGRVVRTAPDGVIVQFCDVSEETQTQLVFFNRQIAELFRADAKEARGTKPKGTLSLTYGSDILFVREYLYNVSAGGVLITSEVLLEKGDLVRIIFDLSGTSFQSRLSSPLTSLGRVARLTEQGVGIRFLDPDEIRHQIEHVLTDYLRTHALSMEHLVSSLQPKKPLRAPAPRRGYAVGAGLILLLLAFGLSHYPSSTTLADSSQLPPRESVAPPASTPLTLQFVSETGPLSIPLPSVRNINFDPAADSYMVFLRDGDSILVPSSGIDQLPPLYRNSLERYRAKARHKTE